ncbi:MAG: UDP-N-acetylmuramoyl-L-alanine--D-glutamate ligase [Lachnospiraceae bacterium]|nr:UDP-N-acetylmuramoyl-L-alanine--D-glutamate ligase [Lachnospiraceae bacterium]
MDRNRILVVGTGISGVSACDLLSANGETCVLFDSNDKLSEQSVRDKLKDAGNVDIYFGELEEGVYDTIKLAVLSPGVPVDSTFVVGLKDRGIPVIGEVELAFRYDKGSVIAITGTNGKTTTTALTGKIMSDHYDRVFVVGNIGNPYTKEVSDSSTDSVSVAEISSFQLETIDDFKPHVSAILNITPDHLNRHHTLEKYIEVKEAVCTNQTGDDYVILNYEDEELREFAERTPATPVFFSSARKLDDGLYYDNGTIYLGTGGVSQRLIDADEMNIIGVHNMENAMAAIAIAHVFGVPMDSILKSVRDFKAVEHRIEFVAEKNGVRYYNDSKGTNVDAAIKGIKAMNRPTCLIGGGYDKGSEYDEWFEAFDGKVKKLVLIGATKHKIAECARKHGFNDYEFAESFKDAFDICVRNAVEGDCVLLSPACASWGMFDNYEQRGNIFKEYVNDL